MLNLLRPTQLSLLIILITFSGCKKEADPCCDASNPKCENYDPCLGKRTINTYFNVRPGDRGFPAPPEWCNLVPTDTFNASSVRFDAPNGNPNSTYEWQIGTELNKRFGNGFEVDFSSYLNAGNWESFIDITLTIITPPNKCLDNLDDTLITVSRSLFFTETDLFIKLFNEDRRYLGYFSSAPNSLQTIELLSLDSGSFRGTNAPLSLVVGLPIIDTMALGICSDAELCYNDKHNIYKLLFPERCIVDGVLFSSREIILLNGINKVKFIWDFNTSSNPIRYEFIGELQ